MSRARRPCITLTVCTVSVWVTLTACSTGGAPAVAGPGATPFDDTVELGPQRPTTTGELALSNLDSQIQGLERAIALHPEDPSVRSSLLGALTARSHHVGQFSDFDRLESLTQQAVSRDPNDPNAQLLRARFLATTHRFESSLASLNRAEQLGARTDQVQALRVSVQLAQGRTPSAPASETTDGFSRNLMQAHRWAAQGRYDEADDAYLRALDHYRDVSPLPVALIQFQRGVMWGESAGRADLAWPLYREAVRTLPQYVVANVHLAELEATAGEMATARDRLLRVAEFSQDPEPLGKLAELMERDQPELADTLVRDATHRYNALLARHPAAFADHAAEFFLGPGADSERAFLLARLNLEGRRNARAFSLAIRAAHAAGRPQTACEWAREALPLATRVPNLAEVLEDPEGPAADCGLSGT